MTKEVLTYAIDFDGVLCSNDAAYPNIGEANHFMIDYVKSLKAAGHKLILWTCRSPEIGLQEALDFCEEVGLEFDAINRNLDEDIEFWGHDTRKVNADVYIDDKSVKPCQDNWLARLFISELQLHADRLQTKEMTDEVEAELAACSEVRDAISAITWDREYAYGYGQTILMKLLNMTAIAPFDERDEWRKSSSDDTNGIVEYCLINRLSRLYKTEDPNGTVEYHEQSRFYIHDINSTDYPRTYLTNSFRKLLDSWYPISSLPYSPSTNRYHVYCYITSIKDPAGGWISGYIIDIKAIIIPEMNMDITHNGIYHVNIYSDDITTG